MLAGSDGGLAPPVPQPVPGLPAPPTIIGWHMAVRTPELSGPIASQPGENDAFRDLLRRARQAGLFYRSPWRAAARFAIVGLLYGAGWLALFLVGDSWYQLIVAAYLGLVFAQVGFLGHDIGHQQCFKSRRLNTIAGLACGNLVTGISYGYWVAKHNQHHAHPNVIGVDPDVGPGVISWTVGQAATKTGLSRLIARHQAFLFFPLACLEAVGLHVASARTLKQRKVQPWLEALLLVAHFAAYVVVLVLVLSPLRALAFFFVQQGLFGLYLACAFAPNHKGMAMLAPGGHLDFVRRQVTTARNVKGGRLLALALGSLNYQIEHHLFPTMPMANLRRCQPLVRAHCLAHGIDYSESTLLSSYATALRYLRSVTRPIAG
jgi:fatty acid desaturase